MTRDYVAGTKSGLQKQVCQNKPPRLHWRITRKLPTSVASDWASIDLCQELRDKIDCSSTETRASILPFPPW